MTRILSLILCMVFLIFVIPSPNVEAVAGVDDLALALLATLAAFGISFTAAGGIDDVGPWVVDKFESFVDSVGDSFSSVVDSMRYGVDKAGNLIGSPESLDYSARFALALQNEYSLTDNSSVSSAPPSSVNFINGFPLYSGVVYNRYAGQNVAYTPGPGVSFYFVHSGNTYTLKALSFVSGSYYLEDNTRYNLTDTDGSFYYRSNGGLRLQYWYPDISLYSYNSITPDLPSSYFGSASSYDSASDDSVIINTGVLDIPQVGDYDDDDGILIDGLGSWGDTLQDIWNKVSGLTVPDVSWPTVTWGAELADQLVESLVSAGELTTENSPGFFNGLPLVGGIPDIQFGNLWHYVTDWVSSMSGGLVLIGGIMFSLPFVAAFYALVVILLVLSLWRLLRSA